MTTTVCSISQSDDLWTATPFNAVAIRDRFWSARIETNRTASLPTGYAQCRDTGRIDAFKCEWTPGKEPKPHIFWDSDVAKWIEAAAYSLSSTPDPALEATLDDLIALIAGSQQSDGYLNSYFTAVEPEKRWSNLRDDHELYCAGHLMEAAAAHFQATGKRTLLDPMIRYADYIASVFGTQAGQIPGYCGHEEIELALIKLAAVTGSDSFVTLAKYFVDQRGAQPHYFDEEARRRNEEPSSFHFKEYSYNQSHLPVREQDSITGHAVRAVYLYSAMADLARLTGDGELKSACERIWDDLVSTKLYVTGGIGPSRHNEGFTTDYDLPNETAYAETCAAIGLVFWAHRMLQIDCDSRYSDVMEMALYNGVISGVSLDGNRFFYENPLASTGSHHRQSWFGCACCPPNVIRLLASLGAYIYSSTTSRVAIHLFVGSLAHFSMRGNSVSIAQTTDYPWDGGVAIAVGNDAPIKFQLAVRRPNWCRDAIVTVNGEDVVAEVERGYLVIDRVWQSGDIVRLSFAMPVRRIYAHPQVAADRGRVALARGPVVYCLEQVDNGADLDAITLPRGSSCEYLLRNDLFEGAIMVEAHATRLTLAGSNLYLSEPLQTRPFRISAIPYFAWDNRSPGEMAVWIREG